MWCGSGNMVILFSMSPFIQRRLYIGLGQEAFAYKKMLRPFSAVVVSPGGFSLHTAFSNLLLN